MPKSRGGRKKAVERVLDAIAKPRVFHGMHTKVPSPTSALLFQ